VQVTIQDYGGHVEIYADGKRVGFINYAHGWHPDLGNNAHLPKGYIYSAYTTVGVRNMGIGSQAYRMFISLMKMKGEHVIAGIPETPRSLRFMKRLGFKKISDEGPIPWNIYQTDNVYELRL